MPTLAEVLASSLAAMTNLTVEAIALNSGVSRERVRSLMDRESAGTMNFSLKEISSLLALTTRDTSQVLLNGAVPVTTQTATTGSRLRNARVTRGLTQKEASDKAKIPLSTWSAWEAGRRRPSFDSIRKVCEALQIDINHFTSEGMED